LLLKFRDRKQTEICKYVTRQIGRHSIVQAENYVVLKQELRVKHFTTGFFSRYTAAYIFLVWAAIIIVIIVIIFNTIFIAIAIILHQGGQLAWVDAAGAAGAGAIAVAFLRAWQRACYARASSSYSRSAAAGVAEAAGVARTGAGAAPGSAPGGARMVQSQVLRS
jgi:hypothetical protein